MRKLNSRLIIVAFMLVALLSRQARGNEEANLNLHKSLENLKFGILAYLDYSAGQSPIAGGDEDNYNRFALTRGYLTLEKEIRPWLSARLTADVHLEDNGDYNVRLKYYYANILFPDLGPLTNLKSEIGMGHMPWLDFEEHINPYRCQGVMAVERAGIFNSSDLGVGLMGYLGGKLPDAKKLTGNDHYDGRFGSWHIGVYNGPGYHAVEENQNKVVEGRITIRPLPMIKQLAGLQLSYLGIYGEGNTEYIDANGDNVFPEYALHLGMLSYENPWVIFTGQYFTTLGNASGSLVDAEFDALETMGYSFFGNVRLPVFDKRISLFGRYDYFDADIGDDVAEDTAYETIVGGIAITIYKGNLLLLSYETTDYEEDSGGTKGEPPVEGNNLGNDNKFQVVLQVKF